MGVSEAIGAKRLSDEGRLIMRFSYVKVVSIVGLLLSLFMVASYAGAITEDPMTLLEQSLISPTGGTSVGLGQYTDLTDAKYPKTGGGFIAYTDMFDHDALGFIVETNFTKLTDKGKTDFLFDAYTRALETIENEENVSDDTVETWAENVQLIPSVGTKMMVALLSDIKPNFVRGAQILRPFNGVVGTGLAILSIVIISCFGLDVLWQIAFMNISFFQGMMLQWQNEKTSRPWGVSALTIAAVKHSESGEHSATGFFLRKRWWELLLMVIGLSYLISGNIWRLMSSILDLVQNV